MEKIKAALLPEADSVKELGYFLRYMDRDKDDLLSPKELKDGLKKACKLEMTDEEIAAVFAELDVDKSGTLNIREFFVVLRDLNPLKLAILGKAFKKLDKDGSGVIDMNDMKEGMDNSNSDKMSSVKAVNKFFKMFDADKDKTVTWEEFLNRHTAMSHMPDDLFVDFINKTWKLEPAESEGPGLTVG